MQKLGGSFPWFVDDHGYELAGRGKERRIRRVRPQDGSEGREYMAPATLFASFIHLGKGRPTEEHFLDFAQVWGLLSYDADDERIERWAETHRNMAAVDRVWRDYKSAEISGTLHDRLKFGRALANELKRRHNIRPRLLEWTIESDQDSGKPQLRFMPLQRDPSLLDGMWWQLGLAIAQGNDVYHCDQCSQPFVRTGRGGRASARFCSAKCRDKFHNDRRAGR